MSDKDIEGLISTDVGQMGGESDPFHTYEAHIRQMLKNQGIETTLGTGIIRDLTLTRIVMRRITYQVAVQMEFPREDKSWTFTLSTADFATLLSRLKKTARKWAIERAEEIIRAEDRASGIREMRSAQKMRHDKSLHELFYFEGCDCRYCVAFTGSLDDQSVQPDSAALDREQV